MADSFRAWLREVREESKMSQSQLDEILFARTGKKAGYTAQLENGRVKAPDRLVCDVIASALGRSPEEAWRVSALERMRIDDVLDFHQGELEKQRREFERLLAESRKKLTADELLVVDAMRKSAPLAALVDTLRALQERIDAVPTKHPDFDLADAISAHLDDVAVVASRRSERERETDLRYEDQTLYLLLYDLYGIPTQMPFDERRQLLQVVQGAIRGMFEGWKQALEDARLREGRDGVGADER